MSRCVPCIWSVYNMAMVLSNVMLDWFPKLLRHIPFLDNKLRKHYESEQLKEIGVTQAQRLLFDAREAEREAIPSLDLSRPQLDKHPHELNVLERPRLTVVLCNRGGPTKILQGNIRVEFPEKPTYRQEKDLAHTEMPKAKEEPFSFSITRGTIDEVMTGKLTMKVVCDVVYRTANDAQQRYQRSCKYDYTKNYFEWEG